MEGKGGILWRIARLMQGHSQPKSSAAALPMERLILKEDTVGHLGLELTELPSWGSFESYAETLLQQLGGRVLNRATLVDMHLWDVEIESVPLRLVYEDYPNRICLESTYDPGDLLVRELQKRLLSAQSQ